MIKNLIPIFLLFFVLGCSHKPIVVPTSKSQLELRNMQSKKIDNENIELISKAVIQVLQDSEFTIESADAKLGFFKAIKKLDGGREKYKFAWYDIYYPIAVYKASTLGRMVQEINATISFRSVEKHSIVRASFSMDLIDDDGKLEERRTIEEAEFYQEFFSKLDKGLFLEKNNL